MSTKNFSVSMMTKVEVICALKSAKKLCMSSESKETKMYRELLNYILNTNAKDVYFVRNCWDYKIIRHELGESITKEIYPLTNPI